MDLMTFNTSTGTEATTEDSDRFLEDFNWAKLTRMLPFLIYNSILMLTGIVGNVIVFNVYYRRFNASVTRTCVLTMSVVDLLTNLVALPVEILRIRYHATFYAGWECKLHWFVLSTLILYSGFILVLVAVDRKKLVCRRYAGQQKSTLSKMKIALAVALGISIFLSIPRLVIMGQQTVTFQGTTITGVQCAVEDAYDATVFVRVYDVLLALWFLLNFVVMNVSYGRIACFLWHHRRTAARRGQCSGKYTSKLPQPFTASHLHKDISPALSHESEDFHTINTIPTTEHELSDSEERAHAANKEVHRHKLCITNCFSKKPNRKEDVNERIYTMPQPNTSQVSHSENEEVVHSHTDKSEMVTDSSDHSRHDDRSHSADSGNPSGGACCSPLGKRQLPTKGQTLPGGKQIPKRTTLMLFVLSVVFVVNFLPFLVLELMEKLKPILIENFKETNLYLVLSNTQYLNSVANPLVYSFCSARFRYECRQLFGLWKQFLFSRLHK